MSDALAAGGMLDAPVPSPDLDLPKIKPPRKPLRSLQFLFKVLQNPLSTVPQAVYEAPIYAYAMYGNQIAWVTAPDLIKEVLQGQSASFSKTLLEKRVFTRILGQGVLMAEGEEWRWQRHAVAPLFRHSELEGYVPTMAAAADRLLSSWHKGRQSRIRQIDEDMTAVTYDVISSTILAGENLFDGKVIEESAAAFLSHVPWEIAYESFRVPNWMPHPGTLRMNRATRALRKSVKSMIEKRRAAPGDSADLFARLVNAKHPETGAAMPDDLLIDNLLTFVLAGHETTAKALTWTLYVLARAPEWQDRLRKEITEVCQDGELTADHLARLTLTQMVLKEVMRLYPPAPVMMRLANRDVQLGAHVISAGTLVVLPIYAIHRHRLLWTDPDSFDPMRFSPERAKEISRYQFLPFGGGPRTCIGASFAMMEATVLLARLLSGARFEWDGEHEPEPLSRVTLRPKGGMPLKVSLIRD